MDINGAARYGIDKQASLAMVDAASDTVPLRQDTGPRYLPPEPTYTGAAPAYYRAPSNFPPPGQ
ncbi:hypothetical protein H4R99_006961 [Coemansia sp. RSA 1722]|nr:hypothetical protein H4R99_006961 [Coemansia sp. RSA 1722]